MAFKEHAVSSDIAVLEFDAPSPTGQSWRCRLQLAGKKAGNGFLFEERASLAFCALVLVVTLWTGSTGQSATTSRTEHVVIVGIDGMKGEAVINAQTPNMRRLMKDGAYTLHARAVIPLVSKPNWSAMMMGAPPEQTGVTSNDWMPSKSEIMPVCTDSAGIFPTIFGVLRDQKPSSSIGVFTDWDGFATLVEPKAEDAMEITKEDQAKTTQQALAFITERKPTLTFIHYDSVDEAGHTFGWDTPQYYDAVRKVDAYIGEVITALDEASIVHKTAIFVTADHGGRGLDHGENIMADIEIPWIVSGPGIKHEHEITHPLNTYDTAPTVAYILELTPPSCWLGKPVLEAFQSHD
jgi:predicted AlkP superfamily pyrophosphatase or phosphodiesterase